MIAAGGSRARTIILTALVNLIMVCMAGGAACQEKAPGRTKQVMEIAERHFAAGRYEQACRYYTHYLGLCDDPSLYDYARFRVALSYYYGRDFNEAIYSLEDFLSTQKNSVWFDKAFETLCGLYYEQFPRDGALLNLNGVVERYYRENIGDYAFLLKGLVHYMAREFSMAEEELKKVKPGSPYVYAASVLLKDVGNIRRGDAPTFECSTSDTYRVFEPYTPIKATLTAGDYKGPERWVDRLRRGRIKSCSVDEAKSGKLALIVSKNARIEFAIDGLEDVDRYNEYIQNRAGHEETPKGVGENTEKDLFSMQWISDGGRFLDDREWPAKAWQAPDQAGTYNVGVRIGDIGVMRLPDKGSRKDEDLELIATVTVED